MKIVLTSVIVNDQNKALKFYTEILGFVKKKDFPVGKFKWITVVSPEEKNGTELLLEPDDNQLSKNFQKGIFEQGIPATSFGVSDVDKDFERLKALNVKFTMEPTQMDNVKVAIFEDTCGNLIEISQELD